jgi:hypothetical protein
MAEPRHASADAARTGRALLRLSISDHSNWPGAATKQPASDQRLRSPASGSQRERLLQRLQHSYGNSYVACVISRTLEAVPSNSAPILSAVMRF